MSQQQWHVPSIAQSHKPHSTTNDEEPFNLEFTHLDDPKI